jgi:uncharacterized membrane protein
MKLSLVAIAIFTLTLGFYTLVITETVETPKTKLSLVAIAIFTLTLGFYTPKVTAAPTKTPKTFTEWCQQKASLPQETRGTVEALLKVAKTQNCSQANQTLV